MPVNPLKVFVSPQANGGPRLWIKLAEFPAHTLILQGLLSQAVLDGLNNEGFYNGFLQHINGVLFSITTVLAGSISANLPYNGEGSYRHIGDISHPASFLHLFRFGSQERVPYSDPALLLSGFTWAQFVQGPASGAKPVLLLYANPIWR